MARRRQIRGNWLASDDTSGFTKFGTQLKLDYWHNRTAMPLKRNLQEVATPMEDPYPVPFYRGPQYESFNPCDAELAPLYVGLTNVRTNPNNAAIQALNLEPGVGSAIIGCTLRVY